jgi:phenylpropionate dioxygenase-like ring-hydroxylating dioxygenase large terminal subunit
VSTAPPDQSHDPADPRYLTAFLPDHWYVACRTGDLGSRPVRREILGQPLVLFRTPDGRPHAFLDRCAHRNVPLSGGRMVGDRLECPYHGWQYDPDGVCRHVPSLVGDPEGRARRVPAYATTEEQGYVWVFPSGDDPRGRRPFSITGPGAPGVTVVRRELVLGCSAFQALENFLDVPHTAFLHRGLFRGGRSRELEVVVRRTHLGVEAEYLGEPRPEGIAARILAPRGGELVHFDRFHLPAISEVEYRLGERTHLVTTSLLTPESTFVTRLHAVIAYQVPFPGWLVRPFLGPVAGRILDQDVKMLEQQRQAVERFGREQYVHTEVDVLGPHIWYLMRQAQRGHLDSSQTPLEKRLRIRA